MNTFARHLYKIQIKHNRIHIRIHIPKQHSFSINPTLYIQLPLLRKTVTTQRLHLTLLLNFTRAKQPDHRLEYISREHIHIVSKMLRRRNKNDGKNPVEMGPIEYKNLSEDGKHGVLELALKAIDAAPGKPVFVNFVEWDGCSGSKEAGKIFADPNVKRAVEECFTPVVFNTWDRFDSKWNEPFKRWSKGLERSDWGYIRIIDSSDKTTLLAGTQQITGFRYLAHVKETLRKALELSGNDVPEYLLR